MYRFLPFFLFFFLLSCTSCEPDPEPIGACELTTDVSNNYETDAIRLAARVQQSSVSSNDIQIPQPLIDRMLSALSAVYNTTGEVRDTVVDVYNIHTLPYPAYNELTVEVDTSVAWTQTWQDGDRLTGNADIDNLMNSYGLNLDVFFNLSTSFAILESDEPLNMAALAEAFETIEGVTNVDYDQDGGDGNNIDVEDNSSYITLTYTVGYDNVGAPNACAGSCEYARSWSFNVFLDEMDCQANFTGAVGDEAP